MSSIAIVTAADNGCKVEQDFYQPDTLHVRPAGPDGRVVVLTGSAL